MDTIDRIFLHQIAAPGLPGGITEAEAAAIRADQAAILDLPRITDLDAVPGVVLTNLTTGEVLRYDGTNWVNVPDATGIPRVRQEAVTITTNAEALDFGPGFTVQNPSAGYASVHPVWGASGTEAVIARRDHIHSQFLDVLFPIAATGSLSSGTRTLASGTVSGLDPAIGYVLTARLDLDVRGEGTGAGTSTPQVQIHTKTVHRHKATRTVQGVDRSADMGHDGIYVSGVSSVSVAARVAHTSGDPMYIDAGRLLIGIKPNR